MTTFDLTPLLRSTIGFDRMSQMLEDSLSSKDANGYPPYNIIKMDEDQYQITMAVAGFKEEELEITAHENSLIIQGQPTQSAAPSERVFLHRGIAERSFKRHFQLDDYIRIADAHLESGLLHIKLIRELPERMKARTIEITTATSKKMIEGKKKAQKAA